MSVYQTLTASVRENAGKGVARALRNEGRVPAVIYGGGKDPLTISVEDRILQRLLSKQGFFTHVLALEIDGNQHHVLPRDVHYDAVTDRPLHVDFLRVSESTRVRVSVPVRFTETDKSPGIKRGGTLNIVHHEIEVLCAPDKIPAAFEISLAGLNIGDAMHLSMLNIPDGVSVVTHEKDFTIATIVTPSAVRSEATAEAEAATPAAADAAKAADAAGAKTAGGDKAGAAKPAAKK